MTRTRITSVLGAFAASLALAAVLVSGTPAVSDAQETVQVECPAGWTPSSDGTQCLSDAVDDNVVTTTSCTQGVLSDDGQYCIVPRLDAAPAATAGDQAPVPVFTG